MYLSIYIYSLYIYIQYIYIFIYSLSFPWFAVDSREKSSPLRNDQLSSVDDLIWSGWQCRSQTGGNTHRQPRHQAPSSPSSAVNTRRLFFTKAFHDLWVIIKADAFNLSTYISLGHGRALFPWGHRSVMVVTFVWRKTLIDLSMWLPYQAKMREAVTLTKITNAKH